MYFTYSLFWWIHCFSRERQLSCVSLSLYLLFVSLSVSLLSSPSCLYSPKTGLVLYQEPDTIKREVAPTGDLYTQPDKPRRNAPSQPDEPSKELPTYQDPNTIQRTMDFLYAEVDRKRWVLVCLWHFNVLITTLHH